jgi:predicted negative regulator of RcsB-dependent stress response
MIELLLSIAVVGLAGYVVWLHRQLYKMREGALGLLQVLANMTTLVDEQSKINKAQQSLNEAVSTNLEILGVHTKLIEPDIAYEASAFLAWFNNKKKEGK